MRQGRIYGRSRDDAAGRACGRWQPACCLLALAALCVLAPLAWASPTDPLWIAGIYDGADHDEEIDLATSAVAIGERPAYHEVHLPVVAAPRPRDHRSVICAPRSSHDSVRAPPVPS
jgi:hypothetical protein